MDVLQHGGNAVDAMIAAAAGLIDRGAGLQVRLTSGMFSSVTEAQLLFGLAI